VIILNTRAPSESTLSSIMSIFHRLPLRTVSCSLCTFSATSSISLTDHLNAEHKDFLIRLFDAHVRSSLDREKLGVSLESALA
jgi:hypothetical protein